MGLGDLKDRQVRMGRQHPMDPVFRWLRLDLLHPGFRMGLGDPKDRQVRMDRQHPMDPVLRWLRLDLLHPVVR
jgi:hypothetical protein